MKRLTLWSLRYGLKEIVCHHVFAQVVEELVCIIEVITAMSAFALNPNRLRVDCYVIIEAKVTHGRLYFGVRTYDLVQVVLGVQVQSFRRFVVIDIVEADAIALGTQEYLSWLDPLEVHER